MIATSSHVRRATLTGLARSLSLGVLLAVAAPAAPVDAQVLYGSLVGTVTDSSRAAVPGATVTATNTDTNLVLTSVTNARGNFTLTNLLPGPYDVKVEFQGFREFVQTGVPVTANTVSRVDVTLEIGTLAETVTVASGAALLQTDRADVHTELRSKEITDAPLPAYRNYQSLMNLVPGATPATFQNDLTDTPARSLRTFVNGQNPNNNATTTDGATNVNPWLPHHVMYVAPAETIDTVNISTGSFTAEQGMAGGAAITVVTKSGTNQLAGSAFEFFNNERLSARSFFDPDKAPLDRHIAGGTLGGPISRDHLFFFGSYEGFFERSSAFEFLDVPTVALRAGDFSNARNADGSVQDIYDPLSGGPDGTGRERFPGNRIPAERISPVARQVLDLYPRPNAGEGAHDVTRNFVRENETAVDRHNVDVKVNWNRTAAHQIWGKYSQMNARVGNLFYLGVDGNGDGDTRVYQSTFGHTWTLSPTIVLDSTFGFSRNKQDVEPPGFELGAYGRDVLGLPGTNGGSGQFASDIRYAGIPRFDTGLATVGNLDPWYPLFRDDRTYAFKANLTKMAGDHEWRLGYAANYLTLNHWQSGDNPRGLFEFAGSATALDGGQSPNFYNTYAAFLLGLVETASKSIQTELMTAREWQHALFVSDRWQLNERTTLDLGLRYEYYPLMTRADRGIERLDLDTMDILLGGLGGNAEDLGIQVGTALFAPRLGFVYRVSPDTVVRTGYGITYNPLPLARPFRDPYPLKVVGTFTADNPWGWASRLEEGIPEIVGPDLSAGRVPLPPTVNMVTPEADLSRGYIQSWNVAVERRLPVDVSINVAYVGTKGTDGFGNLDINASDTPGGGNQSRPFFERFGRNIALQSFGPRVRTEYHGLQIALDRPFRNGLMLKGAYTWSKAMGETTNGEDGRGAGLAWNAPSQMHRNWALQPFDRTHVLQLGFLYEVPFGRDSTGWTKALADGWQINGIVFAYSGEPFTVTADNGTSINMPGNTQTADQVAEPTVAGQVGDDGPYFDPSAWEQPQGVRFGTSGRSSVRGPGGWNADLSLFRGFQLGGTRRLELRAEAFNVFNHTIFGNPSGSVTSSTFMQIFDTAIAPRTVRLGLRFSF